MTVVQWTVRAFGWLFVLVALLGFSASGLSWEAAPATAPRVLGLFPVNVVHNTLHLAFGLWAMVAYHRPGRAKRYATITGPLYLALALLGLLTPDLFGLAPIGGHDIWLHAGIGAALAGVGFTAPDPSDTAAPPPHGRGREE
jgi:hypothetical protein